MRGNTLLSRSLTFPAPSCIQLFLYQLWDWKACSLIHSMLKSKGRWVLCLVLSISSAALISWVTLATGLYLTLWAAGFVSSPSGVWGKARQCLNCWEARCLPLYWLGPQSHWVLLEWGQTRFLPCQNRDKELPPDLLVVYLSLSVSHTSWGLQGCSINPMNPTGLWWGVHERHLNKNSLMAKTKNAVPW